MTAGPAITPAKIAAGDPAALAALAQGVGASVQAYCQQVAGPDQAIRAATEAFAQFRIEIHARDDISGAEAMELLRTTTARAAAARGANITAARSGVAADGCPGPEIELLRYVEGGFTPAQQERVVAHLATCHTCADAVKRLRAGARAFAAAPDGALSPRVAAMFVEAMVMAAPVQVDGLTRGDVRRAAVGMLTIASEPAAGLAELPNTVREPEVDVASAESMPSEAEQPMPADGDPAALSDRAGPDPVAVDTRDAGRARPASQQPRPPEVRPPPPLARSGAGWPVLRGDGRLLRRGERLLRGGGRLLAVVVAAGVGGILLGNGLAELTGSDGTPSPGQVGAGAGSGKATTAGSTTTTTTPGGAPRVDILSAVVHPVAGGPTDGGQRARLGIHVRVTNRSDRTLRPSRPVLLVDGDRVPLAEAPAGDGTSVMKRLRPDAVADATLRFDVRGAQADGLAGSGVRVRVFDTTVAVKTTRGSTVAAE